MHRLERPCCAADNADRRDRRRSQASARNRRQAVPEDGLCRRHLAGASDQGRGRRACKAYRSVADLPGAPDAAFVGVNRILTIEMVSALRERGAGGAICFAAGFLETGDYDADGERLQRELIEAAGDMPIIGPNCYGLINYADGALLWPDQHGGVRLADGRARRRRSSRSRPTSPST